MMCSLMYLKSRLLKSFSSNISFKFVPRNTTNTLNNFSMTLQKSINVQNVKIKLSNLKLSFLWMFAFHAKVCLPKLIKIVFVAQRTFF